MQSKCTCILLFCRNCATFVWSSSLIHCATRRRFFLHSPCISFLCASSVALVVCKWARTNTQKNSLDWISLAPHAPRFQRYNSRTAACEGCFDVADILFRKIYKFHSNLWSKNDFLGITARKKGCRFYTFLSQYRELSPNKLHFNQTFIFSPSSASGFKYLRSESEDRHIPLDRFCLQKIKTIRHNFCILSANCTTT